MKTENGARPDDALLRGLKADMSGPRMMATLGELAGWIKLAGTREERESLKILESRLIDAGFRVEVLLHDAFISLPGAASLVIDGRAYACITHSMAVPTPAEGLVADIVDVGAGAPEDMKGLDVKDRIVLVDGIATPAVAQRMSRLGAAGIIHVSPHKHLHEMCISPVWGSPSLSTKADLPHCSIVTISEADGAALRAERAGGRATSAHMHTQVDTRWQKTPILVADMDAPGCGADDPFVLFSGHHDTWHYGVMDNGSANATIVEVARLVASRRENWRRSVRICIWSGHSQGRYSGSAWYADQNWSEIDRRCVAHVNIDSPGGKGASNLRNTGVMNVLRPLAARAIMNEAAQELAGKPKVRSADESFQSLGIPSMFGSLSGQVITPDSKMRNALGWWWHTPEDLIDKIDENNLVRDAKVVLECLWRLLSEDVLPIDVGRPLADLRAQLADLKKHIGPTLDIDALIGRVEAVAQALADCAAAQIPDAVNTFIKRAARELVMLEHSHGDRFVHEPALNQPVWPVLEPLRVLAAQSPGTDSFRFAHVDAVRACNRITWHLDHILERV